MPRPDVLLAHLSDPHLFAPRAARPGWLFDKRALGLSNAWLRRRGVHRREVLEATLDRLLARHPDHIVVTGDISTVGAEAEMRAFRDLLARKGLGPDRVTVLPGNHDAYVQQVVRSGVFERLLGAYCRDDLNPDERTWPRVRLRGPLAIVACSSAHPSPPLLAVGGLGREQCDRLSGRLADAALADRAVVVALHHPVQPGAAHWHNRLTDAAALREVLARHGATLVLHGHLHRFLRARLAGPQRPIPVVGAPSASARLRTSSRRGGGVLYRIRAQRLVGVERIHGCGDAGA